MNIHTLLDLSRNEQELNNVDLCRTIVDNDSIICEVYLNSNDKSNHSDYSKFFRTFNCKCEEPIIPQAHQETNRHSVMIYHIRYTLLLALRLCMSNASMMDNKNSQA